MATTLSPAVLEHYAYTHQQTLSRIQMAAEAAAVDAWNATGHEGMTTLEKAAWAALLWQISKPAVEAANSATYQYMSAMNAYLGISAVLPEPDTDWFRDDFDMWVMSPLTFLDDHDNDMVATSKHLSKLMTSTTRTAELNAFDQIIESPEYAATRDYIDVRPDENLIAATIEEAEGLTLRASRDGYPTTYRTKQIKRWKRLPQSDACGWCRVLADKILSDEGVVGHRIKGASGEGGKWHDYCRCTKRKLTPQEANDFKPQYGAAKWGDIIDERFDDKQGDETV